MNKNRKANLFGVLYFVVIILEIIGESAVELIENPLLVFITKPLMMPILMLYLYFSIRDSGISKFHKFIFAALLFSWLGDVFLMVTWTGQNLFLYGLSAFLIAHLMYIRGFNMVPKQGEKALLSKRPIVGIPVLLYCAGLIYALYSYGNAEYSTMQFPVMLYAGVIMVMVLAALNRHNRVAEISFQLVFWGALLFMFSDSLIAVNKFTTTFSDSPILIRVLIMSTYTIGQFLIVRGCVLQAKE